MQYPVGFTIRLGIISNVGDNFVDVDFFDSIGEHPIRSPINHPYAGRGGGIFAMPEKGTIVAMAYGPQESWYVVSYIPDINYYFDQEGASSGAKFYETPYPSMEEGEICVKSNSGARVDLLSDGNITIDSTVGTGLSDIELSRSADTLFVRPNNSYKFSEAGRSIEGVVKRDLSLVENTDITSTMNLLSGDTYDDLLTSIGRSPGSEVHNITTTVSRPVVRNPALVEKRSLVYEYAESYNVKNFNDETSSMLAGESKDVSAPIDRLLKDPLLRSDRRTDLLNLNLLNYNSLIETVQGTLVDIYGNVLDINRNVIPVPNADTISTAAADATSMRKVYDYLRRSVKHHFEINSRKAINDSSEPSDLDLDENYGRSHSRFSVDIDGEGLTKINIPASSETGNIPILGRYVNSKDKDDPENGSFRDEDGVDIRIKPVGIQLGPEINPSKSGSETTTSTAYHNMLAVAESIIKNGRLRDSKSAAGGPSVDAMSSSVINTIDGYATANAGGRSLHLNLDGSVEMSVGSDTVDRKSLVLDLAGGVVSQVGKDKNGRSLIQQFDGDVIIQIGSDSSVADKRFDDEGAVARPGRLEIHLLGSGKTPQKLIIDENGMTLDIQGNSVFSSSGDTTISAGGDLLLNGESVLVYGAHNEDGVSGSRRITGSERLILRNGNTII